MTYKEDFYLMLDGKTPQSDVAYYRMSFTPDANPGIASVMSSYNDMSGFMSGDRSSSINAWGIESSWDVNGTGPIPTPGRFILKDARDWKDIVVAPYKRDFDFKTAAEQDMAMQVKDRQAQLVSAGMLGGNYFLQMASFMGFEGAMLAMYDEPEAVHEMLDYLCDYDVWLAENILNYYDVDTVGFGDDNATEINPFVSLEMFREFLLPRYKRLYTVATDRGLPISYHNCGRCEDFMDDMVDIGTRVWNCATPVNDLNAFKAKHDNKVILEVSPRFYPEDSEEKTRQKVRDIIDAYAPGGAFVWIGGVASMNPELEFVNDWIYDEVEKYGKDFYK